MFGRLIDVHIENENGKRLTLVDHKLGSKALLCDGVIKNMPNEQRSSLELNIYNLSPSVRSTIKSDEYKYITIEFGYKDVNAGELDVIFKGTLSRMICQRQDAVTSITKFYCYDLGDAFDYGYYTGVFEAGTTVYDAIETIARGGTIQIPVRITSELKHYKFTETKSLYGSQMTLIHDLAKSVGMLMYVSMSSVIIQTEIETGNREVIVYSGVNENNKVVSASGLIGIPVMRDDGLAFSCLINPRLAVFSTVMMANSLISDGQEGFEPQNEAGAEFDVNGLYRVVKIETQITNGAGPCQMNVTALSRNSNVDYT